MLLFCDSFQHYATAHLGAKWTTVIGAAGIQATLGRRGGGALDLSQPGRAVVKTVTPATPGDFVIGAAVRLVRGDVPFNLFGVLSPVNGRVQVSVAVDMNRSLFVAAGGAYDVVGKRISVDSAVTLPADDYYYVELSGHLSSTSGSYRLRINGVTVLEEDGTAAMSPAEPSETWGAVFMNSGPAGRVYACDLYVLDAVGFNASPFGDVRVDARFPVGPGTEAGTALDGWFSKLRANKDGLAWQDWNDPVPDLTTFRYGSYGYRGSGAAGGLGYVELPYTELVQVQPIPASADPLLAAQVCAYAATTAHGRMSVHQVTRANPLAVLVGFGVDEALTATYRYVLAPTDVDPTIGTPFTAASFQATEFGLFRADGPRDQPAPSINHGTPLFGGYSPAGGLPTITDITVDGVSVATAGLPMSGGAELVLTGTYLPHAADSAKFRIYLRVYGPTSIPTPFDVPCEVVDVPGMVRSRYYDSVTVRVPGGIYHNELTLTPFSATIVARNDNGDSAEFPLLGLIDETAGVAQFLVETIQPQAPIVISSEDLDFLGVCAAPSTALANRALSRIGINKQIDSVLLDDTAEATEVRLHYATVANEVLRDFSWPFATRYADLVLVAGTADTPVNRDWQYAYRTPADSIAARRLIREGQKRAPDPTPPRFRVGGDTAGALLYTDEVTPELEYTARTTCPAMFGDALFLVALEWRLASAIAPALAKDQKTVTFCLSMYQATVMRASVVAGNEGEPDAPGLDPEWLRGR